MIRCLSSAAFWPVTVCRLVSVNPAQPPSLEFWAFGLEDKA